MGLLWIGEKFYATPGEFLKEGAAQGFSRRLPMIPKDFELGKTWVLFAHRKTFRSVDDEFKPGIFFAFKPERVEYILKGTETPEELERKEQRGFTLVKLERDEEAELFEDDGQPTDIQEQEDFAQDGELANMSAEDVL
jgi:hypothetical protein